MPKLSRLSIKKLYKIRHDLYNGTWIDALGAPPDGWDGLTMDERRSASVGLQDEVTGKIIEKEQRRQNIIMFIIPFTVAIASLILSILKRSR